MTTKMSESIQHAATNSLSSAFIFLQSVGSLVLVLLQELGKLLFLGWDKSMDKMGRKRIIMDRRGKEPYLIRYYLLFKDRSESFPFNIFIHKFLKGDDDELHDHPWGYFTFILAGGYNEVLLNKNGENTTHWRGPGFFQSVKQTHAHAIHLDDSEGAGECWTLFIPYRREKEWGFWKPKENNKDVDKEDNAVGPNYEWIGSEKYLKAKKDL